MFFSAVPFVQVCPTEGMNASTHAINIYVCALCVCVRERNEEEEEIAVGVEGAVVVVVVVFGGGGGGWVAHSPCVV